MAPAAFTVVMRTIFSLAVVATMICGCGGSAPGPAVSLVNLRFEDATAWETTATFTLRLDNESAQPVKITGGVHKIYLNDLYVGKGLSDKTVEIPRLSTLTHEVQVHLNNLALATRIKSIIESEGFSYRIASVFHGDSWLSRMSSENSGKLALKDFVPETSTNAPSGEVAPAKP